ncbi:hypothetical protein [Nocardia cyriacigeorgica]|uniref:hypothetical protein n=1 Tax=Nocardia cyriacigeorgica TaxID=135487 RepID=UPI002457B415|nr:hypothetical protein [Nocardia cyriacigeorgica]
MDNPSPDADSIPATEPAAPPAQWCPAHPGGTDEPCVPCGAHRRARADWEAQQAADRAAAHRAEIAARHAAEATRIADCGMCDADGFTGPGVRCVHDPAVIETARRGAARVRAALAATPRRHTTPPPAPERPAASKPARRTPAREAAPA